MKTIKLIIMTVLFLLSIYLIKDAISAATDVTDIPLDSDPHRIAINPFTDQALILSEKSEALLTVDLKTGAILSTTSLAKEPVGLALAPELNIALIAGSHDNTLFIVDLSANQVTESIPVGKSPEGIAISSDTRLALVANSGDNSVSVIDLNNRSVIKTLTVGKKPRQIAIDSALKLALVVNEEDENASVIDLRTVEVTGFVRVGQKPRAIDVNPETHIAAVANEKSSTVTVIDLTNWQISFMPVDRQPIAIAINQLDNSALVLCDKDRTILHIDLSTRGIIGRYPFEKQSRGVAVNHFTNIAAALDDKNDSLTLIQLPNPPPTINSITPDAAYRGTGPIRIMIEGAGFVKTSVVSPLSIEFIDNHHLEAIIPKELLVNAGTYQVVVTNPPPRGGTSNALDLRIDNPAPALNVLDPTETMAGTPGLLATLYGTGFFDGETSYFINGIPWSFTRLGEMTLQVPFAPSDLDVGKYLAINAQNPPPGGGVSNTLTFTVLNPVPILSSLSPASVTAGSPGLTLALGGNNFIRTATATFNNSPVPVTYISSTRADLSIPASAISAAGSYPVKIVNPTPGGGVSAILSLTVTKAPNVEPLPAGSYGKQYEDLIPADATIKKYDPQRFAVITGRIRDGAGKSVDDLKVSIKDHPEYGTKQTDGAGAFSLPVEGGGVITVVYEKDGFITSHRQVEVAWNNIANVENVVLQREDPVATTVSFDGNPATVVRHKSTTVTDAFGSRSLTMVFTGDNRVYTRDASGNEIELTSITTRATEFATAESMPAKLPPNSAYTYCAELSVDGADKVRFQKPITVFVDNFLGFNVGEVVPVGYYDRDRGIWVPSNNGVVVRLLDTNGDGAVDAYDKTGDGISDGAVVGLNDPAIYKPNSTYWRIELDHFSPWDGNWPFGPPNDAIPPNPKGEPVFDDQKENDDVNCTNSYVERRNRIYHEDIPIPGTEMTLHYASNRVRGSKIKIVIPASGATVPASLKSIIVKMEVAGRSFVTTLPPLPSQKVEYVWDGLDYLGRTATGAANPVIGIGFVYPAVYYSARSDFERSFAQAGTNVTGIESREEIISWRHSVAVIDRVVMSDVGEGWTLSPHHYGGPAVTNALLKGDGTIIATSSSAMISTLAGNGGVGYGGNGVPAVQAMLGQPYAVAVDAGGNIFIADTINFRIRKVDTAGIITTVAGNGSLGYSGDGGPATEASLGYVFGIAVDGRGNIFIADTTNDCIRRVDTSGIITTVAGTGSWGYGGDNGPALQARLKLPEGVAVDNAGNIYIADTYNYRLRKVDGSGIITTVAGNGTQGYGGDGGPARQGSLCWPRGIAVDYKGNIFIADYGNMRIRKVDRTGIITTVAGNGVQGYSGDGGPAIQANIGYPDGVVADSAGNLYIAATNRVRKVDTSGVIITVAGNGASGYNGDEIPAVTAMLNHPTSVAADSKGNIFIADSSNSRIRKVVFSSFIALKRFATDGQTIFSDDNGMGYIMDSAGLHQSTIDLATGKTLLAFTYNEANQLLSVTDRFGNQTTIQRNTGGVPVSITSPYGHVTSLSIDSGGKLTRVTYPDNSFYSFAYTAEGLMTDEFDPRGNNYRHQYDAAGKITAVLDPEGGSWGYTRSVDAAGYAATDILTAEGNLTKYVDRTDSTGAFTSVKTDPSGAIATTAQSADRLTETIQPACGMKTTRKYDLDPGYKYRYVREQTTLSPAGLTQTAAVARIYQDTNADQIPDLITATSTLNGKTWTSVNNTLAGTITHTSPMGRRVTLNYDPAKLLLQDLTIPGLHPITYGYDEKGRRVRTTVGGRTTAIFYDASSNIDHVTTPDNRTVRFTYDLLGRIKSETLPDNAAIKYDYDNNGNMTILTNPRTIGYIFAHNGVDLRKAMTMPASGSYSYAYDKDRRLSSLLFPSGRQITNTYANGLLSATTTPEGTTGYSYNCSSFLQEAIKGAEKLTYAYDGSLLETDTRTGLLNQVIGYTYNNDFRIASISYAGRSQSLSYDNDGLLTGVGSFTIARNAQNGLPESITDGTLSIAHTISGYGEMDGVSYALGGGNRYSYSLTRDLADRIVQKGEGIAGVSNTYDYAYDENGRLTEVRKDGVLTESYAYDANGNRLSDKSRAYSYSNEDHIITAGSDTYQFDADGFLIQKTTSAGTMTTSYSSRGELLAATLPNGTAVTYDHDPLGRRIAKRVNGTIAEKYLWKDTITLLAVYDDSDRLLMRFDYADGRLPVSMTKDGSTYYLLYDQIGTLRAVADPTGAIVKQIDCNSFGSIISDTNPAFAVPFGFAGGLHDRDTGLVRFGVRDYDPAIGRWTAKDPIDFAGGDANLYGYVGNNPITFVDSLGLAKTCTCQAKFSAVGPNQAVGKGALGISPPNDSVAINPASFGLPYDTIAERIATQKLIRANIGNIQISAPGLSEFLTGGTTFSIGDVGDGNIRNSKSTRFDIYRFETIEDALGFGIHTVPVTITGVPDDWACPQ
ncbi:MAG: NHL domain-containing protein [Thermoleophilia bacterium]